MPGDCTPFTHHSTLPNSQIPQRHLRVDYLPCRSEGYSAPTMAKPMDLEKIANFLGETRDEAPAEVQHVFLTLEDLWERKLWHQLTETVLEYYATPESESQRLPMYNTFILSFADKINQLKLVILGLSASQQLKGGIGLSAVRMIMY
jgi:hypothetical protein